MILKKVCFKCKSEKNQSDFHKDKNRKDGLFSYCKNCVLEKQKKYNIDNRLKIKEYRTVYNNENAVVIAENIKRYYNENRSKIFYFLFTVKSNISHCYRWSYCILWIIYCVCSICMGCCKI